MLVHIIFLLHVKWFCMLYFVKNMNHRYAPVII